MERRSVRYRNHALIAEQAELLAQRRAPQVRPPAIGGDGASDPKRRRGKG